MKYHVVDMKSLTDEDQIAGIFSGSTAEMISSNGYFLCCRRISRTGLAQDDLEVNEILSEVTDKQTYKRL